MKEYVRFIKKGVFFGAGFLLVVFIMQNAIFFSIRSVKVGEFGVLNKINRGEINANVLICGTSRALKGINPQIIEEISGLSSYSIASDGSDLGVQLPKLRWYLNHNTKPKYIIQELSQFGGDISDTIYEPYKYLAYLNNNSLYRGLSKIDKRLWLHKYFYPSNLLYFNFDFYLELLNEIYLSLKGSEFLANGYSPDYSPWSGNLELFRKEYPEGITASVSEEFKAYLDELANLCMKEEIKLLLTVLPNYYLFSENARNEEDVLRYYASKADNQAVFLLNYAHENISREDVNFYNFTHLNARGADKISERITLDIMKIASPKS